METVFLQNHGLGDGTGYSVCEQRKAHLAITDVPPEWTPHQVVALVNATIIRYFSTRLVEVPWSRLGEGKVLSIF